MIRMTTLRLSLAWLVAFSMACGSSSTGGQASDGGGDATASDAPGSDAPGSDSPAPNDGGTNGDATDGGPSQDGGGDSGGAGYNDIGNLANWSEFNLSAIGLSEGLLMWGIAFDGRYLYFGSYQIGFYNDAGKAGPMSGLVVRYDSQGSFTSASSWSTFDTGAGGGQGYSGAVFDGRYAYFLPNQGKVASRYDTQGVFGDAASWTYYTVAGGWAGCTFDARYVYAAPYFGSNLAGRYDTQAMGGGGWDTFDLTMVAPSLVNLAGGAFDGRYVYFSPNGFAKPDGVVPRYDTQAPFASASSWATFDTTTVDAKAKGFAGAVFDGRYVYLVPNYDGTSYSGLVTRYDTQGPFAVAASWTTFDAAPSTLGNGFIGGVFDGRFVTFVPFASTHLVRYDTLGAFGDQASWGSFDTTKIDPLAYQFHGGAFDGRYLYVASQYGVMLRFDAKSPPSLPGTAHGSFF